MAASDGLSDAEWAIWEPFFPPERGRVGQLNVGAHSPVPRRPALDDGRGGALAGAARSFGRCPSGSDHGTSSGGALLGSRDQGVFEAAFATMAEAGVAPERVQRLDSTVIRAHQHAAGARRSNGGREGLPSRSGAAEAASRPSSTSGLTPTDDRSPLPLTGGERHDLTAVPELLDGVPLTRTLVVADRSYDADGLRSHLLLHGAWPVIPARRHRREPISHDEQVYRIRNRVERLVSKLKQFRRVAT